MKVIVVLLLALNLAACSDAFKTKEHIPLKNKRMPIENCNFIKEQKQDVEEQKVDSAINEYSFNENFDEQPISAIALNEITPNYMEPTDIDAQIGLNNSSVHSHRNVHEVTLKDPKPKKKSYPKLTTVPKKKISTDSHKKILTNKKQDIKNLEQKAKPVVKRPIEPKMVVKKPEPIMTASPSREEIAAKLKQLQASAVKENTAVQDRAIPKESGEKLAAAPAQVIAPVPAPPPIIKSLPPITLPSTDIKPAPAPIVVTPPVPAPTPVTPATKSVPAPTPVAEPVVKTPSAITPVTPVVPPVPASTPVVPTTKSVPASPMKIKVNPDQSVEVYNGKSAVPPPPPPPPPLP